ncbi:hypothetical protein [Mycobacterium sp. URHB0021]
MERLAQARARAEADRAAEQRAFWPSDNLEALVLRVIGGWENLVGYVAFMRFHAAGHEAAPLDKEKLPKAMREIADEARVRWPHEGWGAAFTNAATVRHTVTHMLYVLSVTGECPNRTMNIVRLGAPDGRRTGADGNPAELHWRDETWSMQTRHTAPLQEQALIGALESMKWMKDCCRGLLRIRDILADEKANLSDEKVIDAFAWQVNWWMPEWGDPETTLLTVGHIRLRPGEKNPV